METVYVALGSNLGDRAAYIAQAVDLLPGVTRVSPIYETSPVGGPEGQGPYFNCVVELHTELEPLELLSLCEKIEHEAGRERRVQWEARTLDVDILLFGGRVIEEDVLTVPHPRMWERKFVLAPLRDLAPELVTPEQVAAGVGEVTQVAAGSVRP